MMEALQRRRGGGHRRGGGSSSSNGGSTGVAINRKGSSSNSSSQSGDRPANTHLLAEFRAHEEACASRMIQRAARGFLARLRIAALLLSVYKKQYDELSRQYYYINTQTNETSWDRPRALQLFLPPQRDVATLHATLGPREAAQRIQRLVRVFLAMRRIRGLVREKYMKLFDDHTKTYYYLDTRSGATSQHKPAFLRGSGRRRRCQARRRPTGIDRAAVNAVDDPEDEEEAEEADDLPVEMFYFRRAVGQLSTPWNRYGAGVVGRFRGMLCFLTDGVTLPREFATIEDTNSTSTTSTHKHVPAELQIVLNYSPGLISFCVALRPQRFFAFMELTDQSRFTLCALDETQFAELSGPNVRPLRFTLDDRKMGCEYNSLRVLDVLQVIAHPHGKPQVVHERIVAKLLPHAIAPTQLQYDRVMETGASGSAVFTRGGKLVGIQQFHALKMPPPLTCTYIRPILETALALITPRQPVLLTTSLGSRDIDAYWQLPRRYGSASLVCGLTSVFEVELCCHEDKQERYHTPFQCVYRGRHTSTHVDALVSETMYSLRCRAVNDMAQGPWSVPLRFVTASSPSVAWRIKYCVSVNDALQQLRGNAQDSAIRGRCVAWLLQYCERMNESTHIACSSEGLAVSSDGPPEPAQQQVLAANDVEQVEDGSGRNPSVDALEKELVRCAGLELLVDGEESCLEWEPLLTTRLLIELVQRGKRTRGFLSTLPRVQRLIGVFRRGCRLLSNRDAVETNDGLSRQQSAQDEEQTHRGGDKQEEKEEEERTEPPERPEPGASTTSGSVSAVKVSMDLILVIVALLGLLVVDNASAKQVFAVADVIPAVLGAMTHETLSTHPAFIADCCFLLAQYTHAHTARGKYVVVAAQGLPALRSVLQAHERDAKITYWALVAVGNLAYDSDSAARAQLQAEAASVQLIDGITQVKRLFLLQLHALECELTATQAQLVRLLANFMGEHMRNEVDACEHTVATLRNLIHQLHQYNVGEAAELALQCLFTSEQRRVQRLAKRLMVQVLHRQLARAYAQWVDVTRFQRQCAIFHRFLTAVRQRQLSAGFRRWEQAMRTMREATGRRSVLPLSGFGLALDLTKRKRERYRMLVLQK